LKALAGSGSIVRSGDNWYLTEDPRQENPTSNRAGGIGRLASYLERNDAMDRLARLMKREDKIEPSAVIQQAMARAEESKMEENGAKHVYHADASHGFTVKNADDADMPHETSENKMSRVSFLLRSIEDNLQTILELAATQPDTALAANESTDIVTDEQLVEFLDNNVSKDFHKLAEIAKHFKIEKKTSIKPNLERLASEGKVFHQPQGYRSINFHGTRGRKPAMKVIEAAPGRRGNACACADHRLLAELRKTLEEASQKRRPSAIENKSLNINMDALTVELHDMLMSTPSVEEALGYKDYSAYFLLAKDLSRLLAENRDIKIQDLSGVNASIAAQVTFIVRAWFRKQPIHKYI
jgi:hypothetical protein